LTTEGQIQFDAVVDLQKVDHRGSNTVRRRGRSAKG
jgi:hypothetical protein